jgi:hypothetical protein
MFTLYDVTRLKVTRYCPTIQKQGRSLWTKLDISAASVHAGQALL